MKKVVTWNDIDMACWSLSFNIIKDGYIPDHIISISRGGNVMGTMLSYKLNVPLTVYDPKKDKLSDLKHIDFAINKVLFVDDINDTGNTIDNIKQYLDENDLIKYCTIYTNISSKTLVDYYFFEINKLETPNLWIDFPWEYV